MNREMTKDNITIYTDGSCNTQTKTGAWAAIIFDLDQKTIISEVVQNTTHNRMELLAVIRAIEYAAKYAPGKSISVYTDSQYVTRLSERKEKLHQSNFITKKGTTLNNTDLLQTLIGYIEKYSISFHKVKAHQKKTDENYNREADMICRKLMRESSNK
jgi:ribonuclease HI